jgi:DNA-directed RNA polymerase specialized sigma24 family protein
MPTAPRRILTSCRFECVALRSERDERGADAPLTLEHAECAWSRVEHFVRRLAVNAVRAYPPGLLGIEAEEHCELEVSAFYRARAALATNGALLDDLVQDVACEFIAAVRRGAIASAVPAIFGWVKVVTFRVVSRSAKSAVLNAMGISVESPSRRADCERRAEPANLATSAEPDGKGCHPFERADLKRALQLRPALLTKLSSGRRDALIRWLNGSSPTEIAKDLGISRVAASLRLMHARRSLAL